MKPLLLIIEDNPDAKLKPFLKTLQSLNISFSLQKTISDAEVYFFEHLKEITVVILDVGLPHTSHSDVSLYGGLNLMPRLIHKRTDLPIIMNTPANIPYEALPQENIIYLSRTTLHISPFMRKKLKNDQNLKQIFNLLYENNKTLASLHSPQNKPNNIQR